MKRSQVKKGLIVVVMDAVANGNHTNSITKIIGKIDDLDDTAIELLLPFKQRWKYINKNSIICERVSKKNLICDVSTTFLNKPCYYEFIADLRLATNEEKKLYRKGIYTTPRPSFVLEKEDAYIFSSPQTEM